MKPELRLQLHIEEGNEYDRRKGSVMVDMQQEVCWKISIPIFKNKIILKQTGPAIGIPFSLLTLVIVLTSGGSRDTLYALGLIGALFILTWLFIIAVYQGKYEAEFVLDQKGVLCRTQARQAKKILSC